MSHVSSTSSFSVTGKGWCSYHLLEASSPYFLLISQWTRRAALSCRFPFSVWANLEHPLDICLMVSVLTPQNLHSGVSDVLSILKLIEFVLKACSRSASSMLSVSFLRNLFLNRLHTHQSLFLLFVWWILHVGLFLSSSFSFLYKFSS